MDIKRFLPPSVLCTSSAMLTTLELTMSEYIEVWMISALWSATVTATIYEYRPEIKRLFRAVFRRKPIVHVHIETKGPTTTAKVEGGLPDIDDGPPQS